MTIWTAGSTSLNGSGNYKDGISQCLWTADGTTSNCKQYGNVASTGPQGFRGFPADIYHPRGDDPFPF